ncbi:MAG: RNA-directed DNA polymerase [Oscillospiraceae bacterium]
MPNTIDMLKITKTFTQDGYFSEYLPPSFSLSKNQNAANLFNDSTPISNKNDLAEPISFSMSRFKKDGSRRTIYVPELCSYVSAVKVMTGKNLISDLITSLTSNVSFSPLLQASGELTRHERDYMSTTSEEAVGLEDVALTYVPNVLKKLKLAKGAKKILCLDISNFYGNIYTHLLPAIKLGYEDAELQYKAQRANNTDPVISDDYRKYVELDEAVRNMNGARTNGLLAGTMISQFLAEALLSRIDIELKSEKINYVRYVDDYEVFIYDESQTERIKSIVENTLRKYFLALNEEKTVIVEFPYYLVENLKKIYEGYSNRELSDEEIMKLFNCYFRLEQEGVKGAIRFLVKSISSDLKPKSKGIFTTYLINTLVNDSRSMVKTCELLIAQKSKIDIQKHDIEIIKNLLLQHLNCGNDLEVLWLLYLLKKLKVRRLSAELSRKIIYSNNDLAIVMLMEEYQITTKMINECKTHAKSWLLCYQLFLRNHLTKSEFETKSKIKHNIFFYVKLKREGFSFYHA